MFPRPPQFGVRHDAKFTSTTAVKNFSPVPYADIDTGSPAPIVIGVAGVWTPVGNTFTVNSARAVGASGDTITIRSKARYLIEVRTSLFASGIPVIDIGIGLNGNLPTTIICKDAPITSITVSCTGSTILPLNRGDTIQLYLRSSIPNTITITSGTVIITTIGNL